MISSKHLSTIMVVLLGLSISGILAQQNATEITISLFATDLSGCDSFGYCDGYVTILCSSTSSDWKNCGQTSVLDDDNYPVWPEMFKYIYTPSEHLRWRFDVYDKNLLSDELLASLNVYVEDFLAATSVITTYTLDINGRGKLYIHRRSVLAV